MAELKITAANFENEVLRSDKPVLLDFYADWCGPCKMLAPVLAELAEEQPEVKFFKVNIDENADLAAKYGVMSIPTIVFIKNGETLATEVGVKPKQNYVGLIEQYR